jgi:dihydrofolate reductase
MSENRVIGRNNALPWHLPADMKFFKTLTMGHTVIMGRKTFDTMGKPLPGRRNVVVTRDPSWRREGVEVAAGLDRAVELASGETEVFVAGGAEIYRQALECAARIYLTVVHTEIAGDAYFPAIDLSEWALVSEKTHSADERNAFAMSFRRYERVDQN